MNTHEIAAIGLKLDLERLKVSGQNVANLSTPGYKRQIAVQSAFSALMPPDAQIQTHTDLRSAKLQATGNSLDLALPDACFLLVERDDGLQALTRQSALHVDADGVLRTALGHRVLSARGHPNLKADDLAALSVNAQGQLLQGTEAVDQLQLVQLKAGASPQALGDGLYSYVPDQAEPAAMHAPLRTGHLELSNVVPSQEMVQLMSTTRHAEAMVRLMQTADDMQATAIRRFGENS
ncbi:flagellar hook-basal body protein [Roseateles sp. DB2]|uniref:flagellar hook-basal body protein n=1 Tax=Roseateles sp. DB2 TaxID=3453717 RepID=UPI003EE896C5